MKLIEVAFEFGVKSDFFLTRSHCDEMAKSDYKRLSCEHISTFFKISWFSMNFISFISSLHMIVAAAVIFFFFI